MPGMRTSMITTFGLRRPARSSAALPSAASPTTRMCGVRESERRRPSRTTSWSSTIRTVISLGIRAIVTRLAGLHGERELFGLGRRLEPNAAAVANRMVAGERARPRRAPASSPRPAGTRGLSRTAARTAAAARASARARLSRKCSRVPGRRNSTFAQMPVAPASRAARTTSASCSGLSETPGRIGAMPTRASIPASVSSLIARRRCRGCAVDGSLLRQTSSSSVGIENVTDDLARRDASWSTSTSRTIIGPRVMIENGFDAAAKTSRHARVSR